MSSHNEKVKPTAFELAQPAPEHPSGTAAAKGLPVWVLPSLAALVVLALIVVFWLPGRFDGQATAPPIALEDKNSASPPTVKSGKPQSASEEASPWSDAQLAKLRKEAQDILAILLDVQFELQEIGVEQWAPEPFQSAKALAEAGDLQYRDRQFIEAKASYEAALAALEALAESAPVALQEHLKLARQAIEDGEQSNAEAALTTAALIDPSSEALPGLGQRIQVMAQLLSLMSQAGEQEASADLASAESLLKQATELDPAHLRARAEHDRVVQAYTLERFNRTMSEGYAALDRGRFTEARTAFRQAGKLSPGSVEASAALRDVEAAETAWRLSNLQNRGSKYEDGEQWQKAVETFEKALQIDSNLLFAQEGLARSRARSRLDKQFRTAIDEPGRLSDKAVAQATSGLLQQASAIDPRGPVLAEQISKLEMLLKKANSPIRVTLRSDGQTEVTLRKVVYLGQFDERTLTVRPGTYTAVGSRNGYRDVRRTFTVSHESAASDIVVICVEKI